MITYEVVRLDAAAHGTWAIQRLIDGEVQPGKIQGGYRRRQAAQEGFGRGGGACRLGRQMTDLS
jgi:hypothetical protein